MVSRISRLRFEHFLCKYPEVPNKQVDQNKRAGRKNLFIELDKQTGKIFASMMEKNPKNLSENPKKLFIRDFRVN